MSEKDCTCIYDKELRVPIHDKRGIIEERDINIHISDYCDALVCILYGDYKGLHSIL